MGKLLILHGITGAGKTTVGKRIEAAPYFWSKVEYDELPMPCSLQEKFTTFGRMVRERLDAGHNVVAIEAFIDKQHIDWFMASSGRSLTDSSVYCVWMECDLGTSKQRKTNVLASNIVEGQHGRLRSRFRIPGELEIVTTNKTPEDVFALIVKHCVI